MFYLFSKRNGKKPANEEDRRIEIGIRDAEDKQTSGDIKTNGVFISMFSIRFVKTLLFISMYIIKYF